MDKIDCLLCGKTIVLPDYARSNYVGEIRCNNCFGRLSVTLDEHKITKYKVVSEPKVFTFADFVKRNPIPFDVEKREGN